MPSIAPDPRTYPQPEDAPPFTSADMAAAHNVLALLCAGHLECATAEFSGYGVDEPSISGLLMALGTATVPPDGVIYLGTGPAVFGNPTRQGWAWRCGACFARAVRSEGAPAAGVNYRTERGARGAASRHQAEHGPGAELVEVTTPRLVDVAREGVQQAAQRLGATVVEDGTG
jgi:hypothetical protein